MAFAAPVTMQYDPALDGARILGPVTHGRTVSLAVSPADSRVVAVTGWSTVTSNGGSEHVFLSRDAGTRFVFDSEIPVPVVATGGWSFYLRTVGGSSPPYSR